ncbi:MAG TPA: hypothetical protein VN763_05630, partial [Saprospiraceae bacterium]|nr:hypothetical protein [Saprospiraceae bacterium]
MKKTNRLLPNLCLITAATLFCPYIYSQATLSIDSCYVWAKANYPLIKQFDLVERSKAYNLNTASEGKQPQISFTGSATYQSEVITVP